MQLQSYLKHSRIARKTALNNAKTQSAPGEKPWRRLVFDMYISFLRHDKPRITNKFHGLLRPCI